MDPDLLQAYEEELGYLREAAKDFAEEHEGVAGRLGLSASTDRDPYVERLLEGVAFLAARVNLKLQRQFPEFTQHLLQAIQPNYLAPTPSICIVGLEPKHGDPALVEGVTAPRGSELTAPAADHDTPVRFVTGSDVELLPLVVEEAEYLPTRSAAAAYAAGLDLNVRAGLRIRFRSTEGAPLSGVGPKSLPIFLAGAESVPGELYRQILGDCVAVVAQPDVGDGASILLSKPEPHGFDDEHALLPNDGRSFRGYRLLSEYFACPERFLFFKLIGLARAFARSKEHCTVVLLFGRAAPQLSGAVTRANLQLFATPAINLFEMQLGRTQITPYDHEFLLVPDRTRQTNFEVFRVLEVKAHGRSGAGRVAPPLYAFGALLYDWREALFFVTRLSLRRLSTREQRVRRRSDYIGTETYISLSAPGAPERLSEIRELAVRALVTNRELPELIRPNTKFEFLGAALEAVHVLRSPTKPRPPMGLQQPDSRDATWRVIGHLTPNYGSLLESKDGDGESLRTHLALYGRADDPVMRRQADSIVSITSEPVTRRIRDDKGYGFARGRRVKIRLDNGAFENSRMYLFAAVLDRFLAEFASVNSFIETVFESSDQGEFAQWPPRTGLRPTI